MIDPIKFAIIDIMKFIRFFNANLMPRIITVFIFLGFLFANISSLFRYLADNTSVFEIISPGNLQSLVILMAVIIGVYTYGALKKLIEALGFTSIGSTIQEISSSSKALIIASETEGREGHQNLDKNLTEFISKISGSGKQKIYKGGDPLRAIEEARSRLTEHIARLRNNSIVNLAIAILLALGGIYALASAYTEIESYRDKSTDNFKLNDFLILILAPRVTIAIFIQIFSYFFLMMYRNNIGDVRYFQNELTNIDFCAAAISMAMRNNLQAPQKSTITTLLKTERNRLMSKNQKVISSIDDDQNIGKLIESNKYLTGHIRDIEKKRA